VPLAALFQSPTVRALAQVIRAGEWSSPWQALVPIQVGGSRTPLYLVPPEAATSVRFVRLAQALGPEQPILGFNPLGMDGETTAQDSVEAMASLYLAEIRLLQPEGPYLIGGMCFGATVAYEMAQRLVAAGQAVPLLIILDGAPPVVEGGMSRTARLARLRDRLRWRLRAAPLSEVVADEVSLRLMRARRGLRRQWSRRDAIGAMTERVRACHQTARIHYRAKPYGGRMIVYESSQRARDGRTSDWRFLATGELSTHVVPDTTHQRLLLTEHGLQAVAEHLRGVLGGLDAGEPGAAGHRGE
jgi:thioesterase domain-containing protein